MNIAVDGLIYYLSNGEASKYIGGYIQTLSNNEEQSIYMIKDKEIKYYPTIPSEISVEEIYINRIKDDYRALKNYLNSNKIELYHCTNNGFSLAFKEKPTKKVISSFSSFVSVDIEEYFNPKYVEKFYYSIENAINFSDLITASSETLKNKIISSYNIDENKIITLPPLKNEIYTKTKAYMSNTYLKSKFNFSSDFILYVGDLHQRKRLEEFIEIFYKLQSSISNLYFVILCEIDSLNYAYYEELKILITTLSLENKIIFISEYTELDKLHFYNKAKCLIDFSEFDFCNVSLYEALCCNTPIICSDILLHREILNNYPLYLDITLPYVDEIIENYFNYCNKQNNIIENNNLKKFNNIYNEILKQ